MFYQLEILVYQQNLQEEKIWVRNTTVSKPIIGSRMNYSFLSLIIFYWLILSYWLHVNTAVPFRVHNLLKDNDQALFITVYKSPHPWWPFNPFTPESDQCRNSPAASPKIWPQHRTENLTFHSFLCMKDNYTTNSATSLMYNRSLKGWENALFELRSESVTYAFVSRVALLGIKVMPV